jgi:hypothetical protein
MANEKLKEIMLTNFIYEKLIKEHAKKEPLPRKIIDRILNEYTVNPNFINKIYDLEKVSQNRWEQGSEIC